MKHGASTSTLVRLSFRVPPERQVEFEAAYALRLVPILKKHGLVESAERGRKTVEEVWSRLFEVESPGAVAEKEQALQEDTVWQKALKSLGISFRPADSGDPLRCRFRIYRAPAGPGIAVGAGAGSRQGMWRRFGVADGLPPVTVSTLARDQVDRLWLGTGRLLVDWEEGAGVLCYDGAQFKRYTTADGLAGNTVFAIAADNRGNLWFATWERGVCRYDGQYFTTLTIEDGLAQDRVSFIIADRQGNLWFATDGEGVSRYDGQEFTTFTTQDGLAHNRVFSILQDRQDHLWFGTEGGASRYDGRGFRTFTTQEGLAHDMVISMAEDHQGYLWFGTAGGGVSRYEGRYFETFTAENGLANDQVLSILMDQQKRLWFGTVGGVACLDGAEWRTYTSADGMKSDTVWAMAEDQEGGLWFNALGGGLSRYDDCHLRNFTTREGLPDNKLLRIFEDSQGQLWFGAWGAGGKGLSRYDGSTWTIFAAEAGLVNRGVTHIFEDCFQRVWFCTGSEIRCYESPAEVQQPFTAFTAEDGLPGTWIFSGCQDRRGHLWFGTLGEGVIRYDGQQFRRFTTQDGLANNYVFCALEDRQGYLWFGLGGGQVSRYDGQRFETLSVQDDLTHNRVQFILEDRQGCLWFCTWGAGVVRYDGERFATFTTRDGLSHNRVTSILEDRQGRLWFGTWGGGVTSYDGLIFQHLLEEDGLAQDVVQWITQTRNGDIWFATEGGATRYRPSPTPPSIRLEEVVADRRYQPEEELRLPVSQEFISFSFQGSSFTTRPDGFAYVCRLLGREEEWQPCYGRQVEYQNLPLGEYTFQVRAVDRDLNYSEVAEVRLKVIPDPRDAKIDELEQRVRQRTRELEEKNQALVVEAALERVRTEVAGMAKSGDLGKVVGVIKESLKELGVPCEDVGINTIDEDRDQIYYFSPGGPFSVPLQFAKEQEPHRSLCDHWKQGRTWNRLMTSAERYTVYQSHFADKRFSALFDALFDDSGLRADSGLTDQDIGEWRESGVFTPAFRESLKKYAERLGDRWIVDVPFAHGTLAMNKEAPEPFSGEHIRLLERFAQVFALAYTRFLDLQQAEVQARQARIDAAVERVRAEATAMQKSSDIGKLLVALHRGWAEAGLRCETGTINTVDQDAGLLHCYWLGSEAMVPSEMLPKDRLMQEGVVEGMNLLHSSAPLPIARERGWAQPELKAAFWTAPQTFPEELRQLWGVDIPNAEGFVGRSGMKVPFAYGGIFALAEEGVEFGQKDLELAERFADAVSLGYTRFLDLQAAEERARQQAREAAVERVRAEALSMRSTDDLPKVAAVMWKEMVKLGVETPGCSFQFIDEQNDRIWWSMAQENPKKHRISWTSPELVELDGDTAVFAREEPFSQWLVRLSSVGATDFTERWHEGNPWIFVDNIKWSAGLNPFGFDQPTWDGEWIVTNVPFQYGTVGFREREYSEEHVVIVQELTLALELGYLRFQDFQRLEEGNTALSSANKELFAVNKELQQTLEEKEQAQEALVRSESMAAIGTLVAGVAHELNNPLGAAYSLVQTVQEMMEEDTAEQLQQEKEEIVGHLAFSRKELNRAKEIVAALLGLSRQNQDYTEAIELNTVVQDALRVLYNQYKKYDLNLVEEYGEGLPAVQGNFAQLGQVCMNLIKNAIEALKGREGQIVLRTYREGEQVVFECADTGPGMSEEVRQDIFKPFFTTKAPGEGTGLGLYICHQTVEKHKGVIEVESEVGKGTRFRVRLPAG